MFFSNTAQEQKKICFHCCSGENQVTKMCPKALIACQMLAEFESFHFKCKDLKEYLCVHRIVKYTLSRVLAKAALENWLKKVDNAKDILLDQNH